MRNNTLENIRNKVRAESRLSTTSSRSTDNIEYIDELIKRYYEQIADDFDWPFLRIHKEDAGKGLMAGERYYDFPTTLDLERVVTLYRHYGSVWNELVQGITPPDYSAFNSDNDVRADPVLKWDVYDGRQFEVWPIPASNSYEVRFDGFRRITSLVDDQSRCDLDDIMIALFCAAEILAANKQADAPLKLAKAQKRYDTLTGRLTSKTRIGFYKGAFSPGARPLRIRVPLVRS